MSGVKAVRSGAATSSQDGVRVIRVSGEHGWDLLDRELTCDLYLRDGQARPALLLDPHGRVSADVTVLCADDTFWLLAEGKTEGLAARLTEAQRPGEDVAVSDCSGELTVQGLDGPWAWEVLAAHAGRGVIGLPLLSFFTMDSGTVCLRAGGLGEYGYRFLVAPDALSDHDDALEEAAARVGLTLGRADDVARQTCQLENHVFCAALEGASDLDAGELQLGWRISADKTAPGVAAVRARAASAGVRRTVTFRAAEPLTGLTVALGGAPVGSVLRWEPCAHGAGVIGLAAVPEALAHPGVTSFRVEGVSLLTVSPPLLANRSLYINQQHHRFVERDQIPFPADPATSQAPPG